ncbi:MAG: sigma-70 family RNA polymerase sigma factor [Planctomycetes bacterium]|nr:sigma-70 family RNA polymerase sigma factor [Planctomycetota bacterium]
MPEPNADREARFAEILESTQTHIRAYVAGMGVPTVDVDDIAQEVFMEVYRNLEGIPPDVPPIRWLKGIAKNLCLNYFRRESRRKLRMKMEALAEVLDNTPATFDEIEAYEDAIKALNGCLQQLSEKNRQMLTMRYKEGQTSESIAGHFETTAEAVRITLFRLRSKLKDCVTKSLEPQR